MTNNVVLYYLVQERSQGRLNKSFKEHLTGWIAFTKKDMNAYDQY
jgi:hypothetical protein